MSICVCGQVTRDIILNKLFNLNGFIFPILRKIKHASTLYANFFSQVKVLGLELTFYVKVRPNIFEPTLKYLTSSSVSYQLLFFHRFHII